MRIKASERRTKGKGENIDFRIMRRQRNQLVLFCCFITASGCFLCSTQRELTKHTTECRPDACRESAGYDEFLGSMTSVLTSIEILSLSDDALP